MTRLTVPRFAARWPQALLVDRGWIDGGNGALFADCGDDGHAVGSVAPLVEGYVGCVVIRSMAAATSLVRCPTRCGVDAVARYCVGDVTVDSPLGGLIVGLQQIGPRRRLRRPWA